MKIIASSKSLWVLAGAVFVAIAVQSRSVEAQDLVQRAQNPGSMCQFDARESADEGRVEYTPRFGVHNPTGSAVWVICPVPHSSIGLLHLEVRVFNRSDTDLTCTLRVFDEGGNELYLETNRVRTFPAFTDFVLPSK
jgi:hypothetical protein